MKPLGFVAVKVVSGDIVLFFVVVLDCVILVSFVVGPIEVVAVVVNKVVVDEVAEEVFVDVVVVTK